MVKLNGKKLEGKVQELIEFIKKQNYPIKEMDLNQLGNWTMTVDDLEARTNKGWTKFKDLTPQEQKKEKEEYEITISKADYKKYPIIAVVDKNGKVIEIADGNHRISNAKNHNEKIIKAYLVPEEELLNKFFKVAK